MISPVLAAPMSGFIDDTLHHKGENMSNPITHDLLTQATILVVDDIPAGYHDAGPVRLT